MCAELCIVSWCHMQPASEQRKVRPCDANLVDPRQPPGHDTQMLTYQCAVPNVATPDCSSSRLAPTPININSLPIPHSKLTWLPGGHGKELAGGSDMTQDSS